MKRGPIIAQDTIGQVGEALEDFQHWLESYGETSWDHQSYYAGSLGRAAKRLYYRSPLLGTAAVSPMVFSEAFLPRARRFFFRRQRFPIADAHYAMGFAYLHQAQGAPEPLERARHFLKVLEKTRSQGGWGYPFDWETRYGVIAAGTPMITSLPYVYEGFRQVERIEQRGRYAETLRSIASHGLQDYAEFGLEDGSQDDTASGSAHCAYYPEDPRGGVINASAYRAFLLLQAAADLEEGADDGPDDGGGAGEARAGEAGEFRRAGRRSLNFVLSQQQDNGSWPYAVDGVRDFVDHFHTCFVLKALAKIEGLGGHPGLSLAIDRGVAYYVENLFDERGLPKPFSKAPRLTVYRRELYDYAECVNLGVLLAGRDQRLDARLADTVDDLMRRWRKPDGSFRARRLLAGWDNVPMHRWAQAQLFRALCFFNFQIPNNQLARS